MTAVPATRTWTAGEVVLESHFNTNIRDVFNFLLAKPIAELRQIVSQNFTTGTTAAVTFTAEDVDSSGMHSTSVNTSRATAVYPGWYRGGGGPTFASNATSMRYTFLGVNGTAVNASVGSMQGSSANDNALTVRSKMAFLNVGDYMELLALQSSGGTLATHVAVADYQSGLSVAWESN